MPEIVPNIWKPAPIGENQWEVALGGLRLHVNSKSHCEAKKMAIEYWASCCGDPEEYRKSLEKFQCKAKLRHRGDKFHKLLERVKINMKNRKIER